MNAFLYDNKRKYAMSSRSFQYSSHELCVLGYPKAIKSS